MWSGLLWFLPTFCPHFKIFGADSGPKIDQSDTSDHSVCLGFDLAGDVDQLTLGQQVIPGEASLKNRYR
ncbi:hypothetical protein FB555_000114 [Alpinimonas psychrophila]|uniref:Uncharacterized protein n=1 Tax=Alpinimonas psychrophila TaxID=748908 RepID=A0A7W3JRS6_9MICO|nr:hypothetical protein [Alpinimonas psychrophila]